METDTVCPACQTAWTPVEPANGPLCPACARRLAVVTATPSGRFETISPLIVLAAVAVFLSAGSLMAFVLYSLESHGRIVDVADPARLTLPAEQIAAPAEVRVPEAAPAPMPLPDGPERTLRQSLGRFDTMRRR